MGRSRPGMRSRCAPRCASAGSGETRDSPRRRLAGGAFHPATARSPRFVGACIVVFRRAFRLGKLRGPSHNPPFSDTRTRHAREIGALSRGVDGQVVAAMKPRRFSRMPKPSSTCSAASRDERAYRALHAITTTTAAEESAIRRSRNGDRGHRYLITEAPLCTTIRTLDTWAKLLEHQAAAPAHWRGSDSRHTARDRAGDHMVCAAGSGAERISAGLTPW